MIIGFMNRLPAESFSLTYKLFLIVIVTAANDVVESARKNKVFDIR